MIEVTPGLILALTGIIGAVGCLAGLIATAVVFPGQRRRLLKQIETE